MWIVFTQSPFSPSLPTQEQVAMTDAATEKTGIGGRLVITKMVLYNFKSYGGEKEIGMFDTHFSSVVGPNGSGKSNVIDALLFVFGKRAKKLRLSKVSELIHKSNTYPNLVEASVAVYFQNVIDDTSQPEGFTVVEGSQLCVKRFAFKNNTSKYQLNGKNSTFKLVTDYLQTRGIDLDNNRFLILQGEVEQIAMMKPKGQTPSDEGLLEYLEDIIGSNKYVEETEKAEKVLCP
jgi:structural maintenance of chromosome 4